MSSHSRGADSARSFARKSFAHEIKGRRESRVLSSTRSLACKVKKAYEHSHHRFAETIRPSLRDGVNGYFVLLCLQNLPECADGRFDQNRPSLDLSPFVLKGPRA
jgi:hypothetical protein